MVCDAAVWLSLPGVTNATEASAVQFLFGPLPDAAPPLLSDPELQRELALRRQEIPIIFITAHRDEAIRPRMLERGAVECLFKPFSETALLEALNAALRVG
jgi:FixJ family two-component response regulator